MIIYHILIQMENILHGSSGNFFEIALDKKLCVRFEYYGKIQKNVTTISIVDTFPSDWLRLSPTK